MKKANVGSGANTPLISVITVVYNAESCIEQTILSVLNQTYFNTEYIIIDGGSTDNTLKLINKYKSNITHVLSEPDMGVYDGMNKGIKLATGDWIYFLGAGDILFNVLEKIVIHLKNVNTIYYGDVYKLDELKVYNGRLSAVQLAVDNICHQAIMYPSSVFKKYEYNLNYRILADHDLNMRLHGDKQFKFKYVKIIFSVYEGNGLSANNQDIAFFKDKLKIVKKNFSHPIYYYAKLRRKLAMLLRSEYSMIK